MQWENHLTTVFTDYLVKNPWLDADVPTNFFDVGNLKRVVQAFNLLETSPKLEGSNEEKVKYKKLQDLSHTLLLLDARNNYLKTFDGMCFIPLAIQNISSLLDENIRVVVNVESGTIVEPNERLIWSEYEGLQGFFVGMTMMKMMSG